MATKSTQLTQLEEKIGPIFTGQGFQKLGTSTYIRRCGNLFHIFSPGPMDQSSIRFFAHVWAPELQDPIDGDLESIPDQALMFSGGGAAPDGLDSGSFSFDFSTPEAASESIALLVEILEYQILPWFASVRDRERLWQVLNPHFKEDEEGKKRRDSVLNPPQDSPTFGLKDRASTLVATEPADPNAVLAILESNLKLPRFERLDGEQTRFVRVKDNFYQVIQPQWVNDFTGLVLHCFVWLPEIAGLTVGDPLPDELLMVNGGNLGPEGIHPRSYTWPIASAADLEESLAEIREVVRDAALPWFALIKDLPSFINYLNLALAGTHIERTLRASMLGEDIAQAEPMLMGGVGMAGFKTDHVVFLRENSLPTPMAWLDAVQAAGFPLQMDIEFDPATHLGYLPCIYNGEETGFEFSYEPLDPEVLEEEETAMVGDRDMLVCFTATLGTPENTAALITASVLTAIADGVLFESGEPPAIDAKHAVFWAKQQELGAN